MKKAHHLLCALALLLTACGPSESELRAELRSIEAEMTQLGISAGQYRAQMSQAEFDTFVGSFAAGYGAVAGDYSLAGDGAVSAISANSQAEAAGRSLEQLRQRYSKLNQRREEILRELN